VTLLAREHYTSSESPGVLAGPLDLATARSLSRRTILGALFLGSLYDQDYTERTFARGCLDCLRVQA